MGFHHFDGFDLIVRNRYGEGDISREALTGSVIGTVLIFVFFGGCIGFFRFFCFCGFRSLRNRCGGILFQQRLMGAIAAYAAKTAVLEEKNSNDILYSEDKETKMKKAILAVSYGTAYIDALTNSIEATENTFCQAFPDTPVFRAFTGRRIMEILLKKGIAVDSVEEALTKLAESGYEEILVQPMNIIDGNEYEKICAAADSFRDRFATIRVGAPLLHSDSDIEAVCRFFAQTYCTGTDALVLMGHGSDHYANRLYSDFAETCRRLEYQNLFIATLEAKPDINDIIPELKAAGYRTITITPLLFVAGVHACRDMAGDDPGSWKSRLEAEGFVVTAVVKGLGEYTAIRELYTEHLRNLTEG